MVSRRGGGVVNQLPTFDVESKSAKIPNSVPTFDGAEFKSAKNPNSLYGAGREGWQPTSNF